MHTEVRDAITTPKYLMWLAVGIGLLGTAVAVYLPNPYTETIPPMIVVGGLLGAALHRHDPVFEKVPVSKRAMVGLYLLTLFSALVAYAPTFHRTLAVDVLLVVLYVLTAVSIVALESVPLRLGMLTVAGLVHRGMIYYASALPLGLDTQFHDRVAAAIAATGSLAPLANSKYWYAPVYHVSTAAVASVFGVTARDAAFVVVTVPATVLPVVFIYLILRRTWSARVGLFGGFLYLVSDEAISSSVLTTPTSLGVVLFLALLVTIDPYLDTGRRRYLGGFGLALAVLFFTHQLSLFVAFLALNTYIAGRVAFDREFGIREVTLSGLLTAGFLLQASVTKYGGPAGDSSSFLASVGPRIVGAFRTALVGGGGGRTASYPPAAAGVAVSGADASSVVELIGSGFLFCLGVFGAIYWVSHTERLLFSPGNWIFGDNDDEIERRSSQRTTVALGIVVVVVSAVVFTGPILGVRAFIPSRWFVFLYTLLAILAAPGGVAIVLRVVSLDRSTVAIVIALFVLLTPYVVFMTWNGVGAPDGPILDGAPAAERYSTTPAEAAAYSFAATHANGTPVIADFVAWQVIGRHYGYQPAILYTTQYGERAPNHDGTAWLVYRNYDTTTHVAYQLTYNDTTTQVYGPLPKPPASAKTVFSNDEVRIVSLPAASARNTAATNATRPTAAAPRIDIRPSGRKT